MGTKSDSPPTDLEGCTKGARHCHGRRRSGERLTEAGAVKVCHNPAGWKTTHPGFGRCKFHGGSAPSGIKAAERSMVAETLVTYGGPIDIDPAQALLTEVRRPAGHVEWLRRILAAPPPREVDLRAYRGAGKPGSGPGRLGRHGGRGDQAPSRGAHDRPVVPTGTQAPGHGGQGGH